MTSVTVTGGTGTGYGDQQLNITLHPWLVPKLDADLRSLNETGSDAENAKFNNTNGLRNFNYGYVAVDYDLTDTGFSDVQTFILASIATVVPLLVVVATILGIRFICRRQKQTNEEGYEGVLPKDESREPLGRLKGCSLPQELKTSESGFTVSSSDERMTTPPPHLPTPRSNGSIITMTLKNNHLIVETEETDESPPTVKIESKGTTTTYVTPAEPDNRIETISDFVSEKCSRKLEGSRNHYHHHHHGALIHCPPPEDDSADMGTGNTGLSQSDLSVSSTEGHNPSYRYGNQMGYDSGPYGYTEYAGYTMTAQTHYQTKSLTESSKPRTYYRSISMMERGDSVVGDQSFKNILMSDIQAHEKIIEDKKEMRLQEEQRILGNGSVGITDEKHPVKTGIKVNPESGTVSVSGQLNGRDEVVPGEES